MIKSWKQARQEHVLMGGNFDNFDKLAEMQIEIDKLRTLFDDIYPFVSMDRAQMTLATGEMTSQEWRTLKAVLQTIKERMDE